jgi:UDPglucose--hexose-1-phosphate uridylyltransferase
LSELRKDPITGRWVVFATEFRQALNTAPQSGTPAGSLCPFCPGHESLTPPEIMAQRPANSVANDSKWEIRVIPNKFPVLRVEGLLDSHGDGMYDRLNGIGANEILIESPDHLHNLDNLPIEHGEQVLGILRDRFIDLKKDIRIQYIQAFKNHGEFAGANVAHPHIQMIGLPIVPKTVADELEGVRRYHAYRGRCIYCDLIRQDTRTPERLISENEFFIALAPYASRVPFETWILPKQHHADFTGLGKSELRACVRIMQEVLTRYQRVLKDPAYNWVLHTAPFQTADAHLYHWHIELIPRLARFTGFEWGTDYYINPTLPEDAARFLREASI